MKLLNKFLETELGLNPSEFEKQFLVYEKLLLEWNEKINLVSRKTVSIEDHILNSVFFLKKYDFSKIKKIADIGTGGGFPGIPLKILFPETDLTLIDSIQKKVTVLEDIVRKMNFENVNILCGRAEEISSDKKHKNKYDAVISKAVAPLDKLYLWGKDFLNKKSEMLCIKGGNIEAEQKALNNLKTKEKFRIEVKVINFDFESSYKIEDKKLVIIEKRY